MNVLVVEPGYAPYEKEINGLEEMQGVVGGLITAIYPYEEQVAVVANDEALLMNMEFNRSMPGGYGGVFGPFFVCGLGEDRFATLPPELMQKYKKEFAKAEILLGFKGEDAVTLKVEPKQRTPEEQRRKPKAPERR